jgi:hypothetical protein
MGAPTDPPPLRRLVYTLLVGVASASLFGRILAVSPVIVSANDRSRWATARALVEEGTYEIGRRWTDPDTGEYADSGIVAEPGWDTIDKVLRPDNQAFYSSKPPLLATVVAGEYGLLRAGLGWSLTVERGRTMRAILLTVNWLPLTAYLIVLARLIERLGRTDWGRLYVVTAACFGTFLTTFAVVLNNHTVAATAVLFALAAAWPALAGGTAPGGDAAVVAAPRRTAWRFALAGFFAGWAACTDLPAAAFTAALGGLLLVRAPGRTLLAFAPAAAVPVAAFLVTNYLAIGQLRPAYGEFGGPWYEYAGSFWDSSAGPAPGIDGAGASEGKLEYLLHLVEGHHGLFSLSPVYLLALWTVAAGWPSPGRPPQAGDPPAPEGAVGADPGRVRAFRLLSGLTAGLTLVVVGFYVVKTSNYGGVSAGPRWFFWLTPLLLLTALPAADWLAFRRWGRGLGYALLAVSVLSASYPAATPWGHPWLYDLMEALKWLPY